VARAQREAEILASMNHPNIAQIYGQVESGTSHCLVLEFVDGETIEERLKRGPIPPGEALEFSRQIASALGAAHERGIVHRDLKPANIKITTSGQIKVLDFGLAKTVESRPDEGFSQSPTLLTNATAVGVVLGTAAYMSPEQANGKVADARSDIWSFGVVLYEMLTGRPPFGGESMLEVLGGVLKTDPIWTALPAATPPAIHSLLRRCLQKDRSRRLRDIADARFQIEEALSEPAVAPLTAEPVRKSREWKLWLLAIPASLIAAVLLTAMYFQHSSTDTRETKLEIITPPTNNPADFAISPDGNNVVFQATVEGKTQLWLRPLDSESASPIPETLGASHPFWSANSRSIGFFADQKLKRKDIEGGAAQTLADASTETFGGAWNADGLILYAPTNTSPLYRVTERGEQKMEATHVGPTQGSHRLPVFLPDGRHFLFYATGDTDSRGIYLGSLDSTVTRFLVAADSAAVFAPPDYILFVRQETLFAQRLDLGKLELAGEQVSLKEQVSIGITNQIATIALSASKDGKITYRTAGSVRHQLTWFDRSGTRKGTLGEPDSHQWGLGFSLSIKDEVALSRVIAGNLDMFLMDKRGLSCSPSRRIRRPTAVVCGLRTPLGLRSARTEKVSTISISNPSQAGTRFH
jgi:serine/threonine protein kinase